MRRLTVGLALAVLALCTGPAAAQSVIGPDTVIVPSDGLQLRALLWRPAGTGRFPAVRLLHGSGRQAYATNSASRELAIGPLFARHGYVLLFLSRRGAGLSQDQGTTTGDTLQRVQGAAREQLQLQLLEREQLDDARAGLDFLRRQPETDPARVAIVGHSFGGMLGLLLAERDSTLRALVDAAGAAVSWSSSSLLRDTLRAAARRTVVPVFFLHAANDYSTAPGRALAAEMAAAGRPHELKIYPAFGSSAAEGHGFIFLDPAAWEPDVFAFLDRYVKR